MKTMVNHVDGVEMHQFKAKDSDIKPYPLCLDKRFYKGFIVSSMKIAGLKFMSRVNESKFLIQHESCECKCRLDKR